MFKIMTVFILGLISMAASAQFQMTLEEMKNYTSLMGALSMQRNCKSMPEPINTNFENHMKSIQESFLTRGMSQEALTKLNNDSSKVANIEPFSSCDINVARLIGAKFNEALEWNNKLGNK